MHISTLKTVDDIFFKSEEVARKALSDYFFYLNTSVCKVFAKSISYSKNDLQTAGLGHILPLQTCEFEVVFMEEQH